ncbi:MAG: HEAT repeat domain-containing protein [Pyrinomonadaceae bacterium]
MHIVGDRLLVLGLIGSLVPVWMAEPLARVTSSPSQQSRSLTPLQLEIEKQRQRLSAPEVEERRAALMRLAALRHPDASRAAVSALNDPSPMVRVTAATAALLLPADESAAALLPLLKDKDGFVRQEVVYALGRTGNSSAVEPLIERLVQDKKSGVRGAAAVALGQIRNEAAVAALSQVLSSQIEMAGAGKAKRKGVELNVFVLRAAAKSLGQIGSARALPALLGALKNEKAPADVRREAATSLGMIGDPSATPALREALAAEDAYLSQAAHEALLKIARAGR